MVIPIQNRKMLIQRSRRMMIMKKLILYFYQTQRQGPFRFDILVKCYNFSVGKLSILYFIWQNSIRSQISLVIFLQALKMIHFLFGWLDEVVSYSLLALSGARLLSYRNQAIDLLEMYILKFSLFHFFFLSFLRYCHLPFPNVFVLIAAITCICVLIF